MHFFSEAELFVLQTACQQCEPVPHRQQLDKEQRPCPLGHSDALGTLRPVTWGTLRVIRATGPLRYADPPAAAACRVLPVPPAIVK